jgi:hypothetical protein
MAEITADTSFYPKAPAQKGLLDQVQQYGAIEQQQLNIDKSKLELAITNQGQLLETLNSLPKDATREDLKKWGQTAVKMKLVNPKLYAEFMTNMPTLTGDPAKDSKALNDFRATSEQRAMTTLNAMQWKYGQQFDRSSGQSTTPMRKDMREGTEVPTGAPIAAQLPPQTQVFDPTINAHRPVGQTGDQLPQGAQPAPGAPGSYIDPGMPLQPRSVPTQSFKKPGLGAAVEAPPEGPITNPNIQGQSRNFGGNVLGATVENAPADFNSRFGATKPVSSPPAMFDEGKKMLVGAQQTASERAMAIKPLIQALPLMMKPGFMSGPGSDQFTNVVAALKTFGLIDTAAENDPTAVRQEVGKKLAQYISGSPIAGRSDAAQALSEASSPNPNKNILPALMKLTKDAIALERLNIAKANTFKDKDLSKVGEHFAKFPQSIDERAFSLDLEENAKKIVGDMSKKLTGNAKEKAEARKFFRSLEIAEEQGFYQ